MLLAACPGPGTLAPLVPMPLAPVNRDSALAWTRSTVPAAPTLIRFRWRYQDERVKYAGHGSARIAPPDSLRFDYAGPLGLGTGAAVLIGDSVAWADPEKNFRSLVPAIPMLWAAFAMIRPPAPQAAVSGLALADSAGGPRRTIWRFAQAEDTLDYVVTDSAGHGSLVEAEWRRRGKTVARSRSVLDPRAPFRRPVSARVDFPASGGSGDGDARFELMVGAIDTAAVIPPALWLRRR